MSTVERTAWDSSVAYASNKPRLEECNWMNQNQLFYYQVILEAEKSFNYIIAMHRTDISSNYSITMHQYRSVVILQHRNETYDRDVVELELCSDAQRLGTENHETAAAAQTFLEFHVVGPVHPVCNGVKSIIWTKGGEGIVQYEGPFGLNDATDVGYSVAKESLTCRFFQVTNIQRVTILEMAIQFQRTATSSVPPTLLPRSHTPHQHQAHLLDAHRQSCVLPRKTNCCKSLRVTTITKIIYTPHYRKLGVISKVTMCNIPCGHRRCRHRKGYGCTAKEWRKKKGRKDKKRRKE